MKITFAPIAGAKFRGELRTTGSGGERKGCISPRPIRRICGFRGPPGSLQKRNYKIVSGGTDNHLFLIDLIDKDITGKDAEAALGAAFITVNKNTVPKEPRSPFVTSGLRMGTPAITTRGMKQAEASQLAEWICDILDDINNQQVIADVKTKVLELTAKFPVYLD